MNARLYDSAKDKHACWRIYKEVGWIDTETEDELDNLFTRTGRTWVAEMEGEAECAVIATPGDLQYLDERLQFSCITGVTTSRLGRKQGLAGRLTAHAIAEEVASGAIACGLGMFEQGYYNQLGMGSGPYEHTVSLPLQELPVTVKPRVPKRLGMDDWEALHACRLKRRRGHGSSSLFPPEMTLARMHWGSNHFGLGYTDEPDGSFSHLIWCTTDSVDHGPYWVKYLLFQTREQFLELLGVLKTLGDQVITVSLTEPADLQLQDLIHQPFRMDKLSTGSRHKVGVKAHAWWQMRICDLPACLAQTKLNCGDLRFNLSLTDPIERFLDEGRPWRGVAGDYVVTLGTQSSAEPGTDPSLPTLRASVNAFTRMWLGVRPASGLAFTDDLQAPEELLRDLDAVLRLPTPWPDWDF